MPTQYHINRDDEFVALRLKGDVDLVATYELCQSLLADPEFDPHLPQLVDVREVRMQLTHGAMRPFLGYVRATYRPRVEARIAVVLDGTMDDDFCAGVFRFVCNLPDTEVFDDYALAIKWLLKSRWINRTNASAQPENSARNQADEEPKQIRA